MSSKMSSDIMHSEFVHITPDHESELCNKLYRQWQETQHCDLLISAKGGNLRAHSCVVAAFSPKLKILLENSAQFSDPSVNGISVHLKFEVDVFRCLLNMMYTGVLSFNTTMLSSVMSTARWMQMEEVVRLCQEYKEVTGNHNDEAVLTDEAVLCERDTNEDSDEQRVSFDLVGQNEQYEMKHDSRIMVAGQVHHKRGTPSKGISARGAKRRRGKNRVHNTAKETVKLEAEADSSENGSERKETGNDPSDGNEADPSDFMEHTDTDETAKKSSAMKGTLKRQKGKKSASKRPKVSPKKQQETKPASSDSVRVKSEQLPSDKEEDSTFRDPSVMSHSEWVEAQHMGENDKEEVDFALGKMDRISCKRCMMKFTQLDEYFRHVTNHPTFTCDICITTYYRKSNLTRHMRTNHFSQHHLRCKKCDFVAKTEKSLRIHFKDIHGDDKPFACDHPDCTYATWKFDFLHRHAEIHSEVKRYICNKCGQGFAQHAGLMSHQRACFHLQQFLCDVCGQSFNHVQSMRSHRRTIHFGEKPYLCKVCGNQFSDQRNLKRHLLIHENTFPYHCPICQQNYRHSNSLKAHLKKHGDVSIDLNMIGIAQSAQSRQKRKRTNTAEKAKEKTLENSSAGLHAEDVIRSEAGDMCLSNTGASHGVGSVSDIVFPGQSVPGIRSQRAVGVLAPNPRAGLQQSNELLKQLNSTVDSGHTVPTTIVPMMVPDAHQMSAGDAALITSAFGARAVSIAQFCKPPEEKYPRMEQVSASGSNPSRLHPLMNTTTAMPMSVFNIEMLTTDSSGGSQAPRADQSGEDHERGEGGEGSRTDKKLKGQSSYGLQTLAEICFNSSA